MITRSCWEPCHCISLEEMMDRSNNINHPCALWGSTTNIQLIMLSLEKTRSLRRVCILTRWMIRSWMCRCRKRHRWEFRNLWKILKMEMGVSARPFRKRAAFVKQFLSWKRSNPLRRRMARKIMVTLGWMMMHRATIDLTIWERAARQAEL